MTAHRLAIEASRAQPLCTNLLGPAAAHRGLSSSSRLGQEPQAGLLGSSVLLVPGHGQKHHCAHSLTMSRITELLGLEKSSKIIKFNP